MTFMHTKRRGNEVDLSDLIKKNQIDLYVEKPLATLLDVYIIGEIGEASDYIEVFDKIRNSGEHDVVRLHINSQGGYLSTAIQFMRCLNETSARIIASVEGECASAATLLMLCAHSFEISDHSLVMCHTYSAGMYPSKGHEIRDRARFDENWSNKLFRDAYKHFMSDEEITQMIEGKDFWFSAEETIDRLNKRTKILAEEAKSNNEED